MSRYNVFAIVSGMEEEPVRTTKGRFKEIAKVGGNLTHNIFSCVLNLKMAVDGVRLRHQG